MLDTTTGKQPRGRPRNRLYDDTSDLWSADLMTSGSFRWPCKINKCCLSVSVSRHGVDPDELSGITGNR